MTTALFVVNCAVGVVFFIAMAFIARIFSHVTDVLARILGELRIVRSDATHLESRVSRLDERLTLMEIRPPKRTA